MTQLFSAPGKLLLAGGYLVLFPEYHALVVALSSRMHATVKGESVATGSVSTVKISSPQFAGGNWEYQVDGVTLKQVKGGKNPFIETTLDVIVNYCKDSVSNGARDIDITIYSDLEYHSQDNTTRKSNGKRSFLYHVQEISDVAKTGLGSSAGLVTVLVLSLLSQFTKGLSLTEDRNKIHNLSQIAHCKAQGKIGSGFDVASATFGSIQYQRFKPDLIKELVLGDFTNLNRIVDDTDWEFQHEKCCLPPGIKLLMGDVSGGSNTPKLVSKVLSWRLSNEQKSKELFTNLNLANTKLINAVMALNEIYETDKPRYEKLLLTLSTHTSVNMLTYSSFPAIAKENKPLLDVIDAINEIRCQLRLLTKETGAEIEPFQQTQLLNQCSATMNGCLGGVVPGAGGYDAICLLCHEGSIAKIMSTKLENVRWLDLCEDVDGLKEEIYTDYQDLK